MKKYLFTLILALLLASFASAAAAQDYYTLPEIREQAAQGWHETYTDRYGKTHRVDVDIDVFGEETAPVLKARWNSKDLHVASPSGNPRDPFAEARNKGLAESIYLQESVSYKELDLDRKYGEGYGSDLTLREAYDFCAFLLQGMGKDFYRDYLWEKPREFEVLYSRDTKTGGVYFPAVYSMSFAQRAFGLPIITRAGDSFEQLNVAISKPSLQLYITSEEAFSCSGMDFAVSEVLADDIPLCSVETALEGARKMIEDGYVRHITGMRFGYVVYSDPDTDWSQRLSSLDVDTWYLVPAWVMECHVMWDPKDDDSGKCHYREIAINAQTGEIPDYFDRSLNGGGDVRYKGFISWDDVQQGG